MPIYEYVCDACGHELEALQKISDAPLKQCPECSKESLRKKVSAAAFRLKGGGWYETDFKSGGKKNLAGESDSGANKSEGTKEGKASGGDKSKAGSSEAKSTSESKSTSEASSKKDAGSSSK